MAYRDKKDPTRSNEQRPNCSPIGCDMSFAQPKELDISWAICYNYSSCCNPLRMGIEAALLPQVIRIIVEKEYSLIWTPAKEI
jgi:hypothetical protein